MFNAQPIWARHGTFCIVQCALISRYYRMTAKSAASFHQNKQSKKCLDIDTRYEQANRRHDIDAWVHTCVWISIGMILQNNNSNNNRRKAHVDKLYVPFYWIDWHFPCFILIVWHVRACVCCLLAKTLFFNQLYRHSIVLEVVYSIVFLNKRASKHFIHFRFVPEADDLFLFQCFTFDRNKVHNFHINKIVRAKAWAHG